MYAARHGGSLGGPLAKPLVGARGGKPPYFPELCRYRCKESNKNIFITKVISVRHSGFAMGRGSLLGIVVAVCLDLALVFRK